MAQFGKSLRRVVLEDDDEIRTIEGEGAERWMDAVNSRVVFLAFHAGFGEFPAFRGRSNRSDRRKRHDRPGWDKSEWLTRKAF